jgi:long-chain fatty acid transport protein
MHTHHRSIQMSALALGIFGALAFGQAHASGFQLKENSVKAMGRAFAGAGVAKGDASVVVNNPATMTDFEGTTIQADVTVIDLNAEFNGSGYAGVGLGPLAAPLTGGEGGDIGEPTPVPAMSFIHKFDNGLTLGAMVSAPFGLKTEYDKTWRGRYSSTLSEVKTVDLTLALAYEIVPDRFSVGAALVYERAEATLDNAIDFGTIGLGASLPGFAPQNSDGSVSVHGDDTGFGYIVGLNFRPTETLTLGLSHRSEIDHDLRGTANFTVPTNFAGAQPGLAALAANPLAPLTPAQRAQLAVLGNGFRDTGVSAPLTTPSVTSVSAAWQFNDKLALMGEFAQTDWHSVQAVTIDFDNPFQPNSSEAFNWTDTRFWSIGAEYALSDTLTLRGGYAYDETPTTFHTRTTRLPDEDRRWYSLGLTWALNDHTEISAAYTRIQPDTPKIGLSDSTRHVLFGDYSSDVNLFGVSGQYRF